MRGPFGAPKIIWRQRMGGYNTLVCEAGYLSNVRLKASAANGITQADLDAAEAHARAETDAELSMIYDTSAWEAETPAIVERIADMLSSTEVLEYKYQRGDTAGGDDTNLPAVLAREGRGLLRMIKRGLLAVVDTGGAVQTRLTGDALPAAEVAEAEFFPAVRSATSFGKRTRHNLEDTYVGRGA